MAAHVFGSSEPAPSIAQNPAEDAPLFAGQPPIYQRRVQQGQSPVPIIIGLVIAAVLAASMSTLSSSLNSSAGAFVTDFYRPLRPGLEERAYMVVSRWMTLLWGVTRIAVALFALRWLRDRSVIDQVFTVAGFTTGMILGLFLLGSLRRPVPSWAALAGLVAGFVVVFVVWLPPLWGDRRLAWPWYAPVGTVTTVAVALALNLLKKRDSPQRHKEHKEEKGRM